MIAQAHEQPSTFSHKTCRYLQEMLQTRQYLLQCFGAMVIVTRTKGSNEFIVELIVEKLVDELCFISSFAGGKANVKAFANKI